MAYAVARSTHTVQSRCDTHAHACPHKTHTFGGWESIRLREKACARHTLLLWRVHLERPDIPLLPDGPSEEQTLWSQKL